MEKPIRSTKSVRKTIRNTCFDGGVDRAVLSGSVLVMLQSTGCGKGGARWLMRPHERHHTLSGLGDAKDRARLVFAKLYARYSYGMIIIGFEYGVTVGG